MCMTSSTRLVSRNVYVGDRKTSMRLEPELWAGLAEVCQRERITRDEMIARAVAAYPGRGVTSAVRTYLLMYYRAAAPG